MRNTTLSVVIPAYNHENFLYDSVMSVINQSVPPAEIIIVNDGSTDNTTSICRELSTKYPIIRLIEQENMGAHNALNRGIEKAQSKYIAVLNSDDTFLPNKLESCLDLINDQPEVDFIVHTVLFIDEHSQQLTSGITVDWYKRAWEFYRNSQLLGLSLLNENFVVTTSNMVFSKLFWQKATGFQPLRYCHDLEFLLEANRNADNIAVLDQALIQYRTHPTNTIKEDIQRVRVEIAAVTAQAIVEGGPCFLDTDKITSISLFREFLRNKNLSDLALFLIMTFLNTSNKTTFYNKVLPDQNKDHYAQLLD